MKFFRSTTKNETKYFNEKNCVNLIGFLYLNIQSTHTYAKYKVKPRITSEIVCNSLVYSESARLEPFFA